MAVGPVFTGLSLLLLPGQPIFPSDESPAVSDTWSLTEAAAQIAPAQENVTLAGSGPQIQRTLLGVQDRSSIQIIIRAIGPTSIQVRDDLNNGFSLRDTVQVDAGGHVMAHFTLDGVSGGDRTFIGSMVPDGTFVEMWAREIPNSAGFIGSAAQIQPGVNPSGSISSGLATPTKQPYLLSGFTDRTIGSVNPTPDAGFVADGTPFGADSSSLHQRYTDLTARAATWTNGAGSAAYISFAALFAERSAENAAVSPLVSIATSTDSWALTAETEHAVQSLYGVATDIGLISLLPSAPRENFDDKTQAALTPVALSDVWALSWTEGPVDNSLLDMWDAWLLTANEQPTLIIVSQTFPSSENWLITFNEASTLATTGGTAAITPNDLWAIQYAPEAATLEKDLGLTDTWSITESVEQSATTAYAADRADTWSISFTDSSSLVQSGIFDVQVSDTWGVQWNDASLVAQTLFVSRTDTWALSQTEVAAVQTNGTMDIVDTWSLQWNEASDVRPSPMSSDLTDTWRLSTVTETTGIANIPVITIIGSDQWSLHWGDSGHVSTAVATVPKHRRVFVGGPKRRIRVQ